MDGDMGDSRREESAAMKIVWSPRAIQHLVKLRNYIARDSDQNANVVAQRIVGAVSLLSTQPEIGRPGRVLGTRELVIPHTPYVAPYRVRKGRVEVIAIFHGHQVWPKKL
jgi:toxin ParE1/3/4